MDRHYCHSTTPPPGSSCSFSTHPCTGQLCQSKLPRLRTLKNKDLLKTPSPNTKTRYPLTRIAEHIEAVEEVVPLGLAIVVGYELLVVDEAILGLVRKSRIDHIQFSIVASRKQQRSTLIEPLIGEVLYFANSEFIGKRTTSACERFSGAILSCRENEIWCGNWNSR
jgi:hypothetical protein